MAVAARLRATPAGAGRRAGSLAMLTGFTAAVLLITVTPGIPYGSFDGVVQSPTPQLSGALGGNDGGALDVYRVTTELPGFVGPAAYPGQRLMMWWPADEQPQLVEPIGIFHAYFVSIRDPFGVLSADEATRIEAIRPALMLLMSTHAQGQFANCERALAPYRSRLLRTGALTSGSYVLHLWLIELGAFSR
jgi:hypothetical protein